MVNVCSKVNHNHRQQHQQSNTKFLIFIVSFRRLSAKGKLASGGDSESRILTPKVLYSWILIRQLTDEMINYFHVKKQKQRLMKYGLGVIIFCGFFIVTTVVIKAAVGGVTGWGWGGSESQSDGNQNNGNSGFETGVGWISMNRINCDSDDDGKSDGTSGCPASGTPIGNYGVNIPSGDGAVTGNAWNENIGWIQFDPSGPYPTTGCNPACPATSVRRSGNDLVGWARIVGIAQESAAGNSGGWSGWIKMKGSNYGVTINGTSLEGFAWSDELGYINFTGVNISVPLVVTLSADPITINVDNDPHWDNGQGTPIKLTWNITGATNCTKSANNGGTWNGSTSATDFEIVHQKNVAVTYALTCTGITDPITVTVSAGCYPNACDATARCVKSTTPITPAVSSDVCIPSNTCSVDADCVPRQSGNWREVAP